MEIQRAWNGIKIEDWLHKKAGKLLVLGEAPTRVDGRGKRHRYFLCECDCGKVCEVKCSRLKSGKTTSCGCFKRENGSRNKVIIHGMTNTPTHASFTAMKRRCCNPNSSDAERYYERGITICDRWMEPNGKGFINFLEDMGERPGMEYSIDRLNNDAGYSKENCAWKTMKEQSRNRRSNVYYEYGGVTRCVSEWEEILNYSKNLIASRLKTGLTFKEVVEMGPESTKKKPIKVENTETGEIEIFDSFKEATVKYPGMRQHLNEGKIYRKILLVTYYKPD